jgi:hypothetical protein
VARRAWRWRGAAAAGDIEVIEDTAGAQPSVPHSHGHEEEEEEVAAAADPPLGFGAALALMVAQEKRAQGGRQAGTVSAAVAARVCREADASAALTEEVESQAFWLLLHFSEQLTSHFWCKPDLPGLLVRALTVCAADR